jgi:hypothetical protein
MYALIRNSEGILLALGVLKAVAWLASLAAATAGVCAWLVAICELDWAILHLGDSPIATAALLGAFVIGCSLPGVLIVTLWVGAKDGLRDCLASLDATPEEPSPVREAERECVEEIRKHLRIGLGSIESIVEQLREQNKGVTLLALDTSMRDLADTAEDAEREWLDRFADCLYELLPVRAEKLFDRAVAQGACPVGLLKEILGC